MSYIKSKLFQIQIIIQLIFIGIFYFIEIDFNSQAVICGILLCTVGIPHGSNDYLYRSNVSTNGLLKFLFTYLSMMAIFGIAWWLMPFLALLIFFFISIHHFGQSNFENSKVFYLPSILWGTWVLLLPVLIHSDEAINIFKQMLSLNDAKLELIEYPLNTSFNPILISIFLGFSILYFLSLNYFESKNKLKYFIQFIIVTIWYLITPLLFGFIIFFCLWHSMQSLKHQSEYYIKLTQNNLTDFILKMIPFSLIALGFFAVYIYFRGFILSEAFILLSIITFPHVLKMDSLYKKADNYMKS